jgi:hypothetical protein
VVGRRAVGGADRTGAEARPGRMGDELIRRRAYHGGIDSHQIRRILGVWEVGEGQKPRPGGLPVVAVVAAPARGGVEHERTLSDEVLRSRPGGRLGTEHRCAGALRATEWHSQRGQRNAEEAHVSVARITEITARSSESFEDAVNKGIERANDTLRNVQGRGSPSRRWS